MNRLSIILIWLALTLCCMAGTLTPMKLEVSPEGRYLRYADGKPFFYFADTGWLLPQRLNRDEAEGYLQRVARAGFNVVQVQVMNTVPSVNIYGQLSCTPDLDFEAVTSDEAVYDYWDHMDYIIDTANDLGIYIGMVCVWGSNVKSGKMDKEGAQRYGQFLAQRYKDRPNIIWIIGGDIQGDIHQEVWEALAETIKAADNNHLMTFHPRGRTTSAYWFANAPWIDFHAYQSGHRRYNQRMGNKEYPIQEGTEEDCWMYVDSVYAYDPSKPVIDLEPSYEAIPKGLHDADEERWNAAEARRYAWWDVMAGCAGHCYGHNNIMQFCYPGTSGAYFADPVALPWWLAQEAEGYQSMRYLRALIEALPYFERRAAQGAIVDNGEKYHRMAASQGDDYLIVYDYLGDKITVRLDSISGNAKRAWWMDASNGSLTYLGEHSGAIATFGPAAPGDGAIILIDASKSYLSPTQLNILSTISGL